MSLSLCAVSAEVLACHVQSMAIATSAVLSGLSAPASQLGASCLEVWMALLDGCFYGHSLAYLHEQGAPCIRGLLRYIEHFRLMHKGGMLHMQVDQWAFQVHTAQSCGGWQRRPLLDPLLL